MGEREVKLGPCGGGTTLPPSKEAGLGGDFMVVKSRGCYP